jgi:hypothetical protein
MLLNLTINRRTRKVIPPAAKNGFFYVLDRVTGELISAEPFVKVSWALGIGKHGRPVVNPGREMTCSRPSGKSQTTRLSDSGEERNRDDYREIGRSNSRKTRPLRQARKAISASLPCRRRAAPARTARRFPTIP